MLITSRIRNIRCNSNHSNVSTCFGLDSPNADESLVDQASLGFEFFSANHNREDKPEEACPSAGLHADIYCPGFLAAKPHSG